LLYQSDYLTFRYTITQTYFKTGRRAVRNRTKEFVRDRGAVRANYNFECSYFCLCSLAQRSR